MKPKDIYAELQNKFIYSPHSREMARQELSLIKYLSKEYKKYASMEMSLHDIGVTSNKGELMKDTSSLLEVHYDERFELFQTFLDNDYLTYTMAYYGENADNDISLEDAQRNKFKLICERIGIVGNENILNIGCGFGSFEKFMLSEYPDITITGLTPSKVQSTYLESCISNPDHPLSNRFKLVSQVFDQNISSYVHNDLYDVVISIGVFEQLNNMKEMLRIISTILKPEGKTFHHFITSSITTPQTSLDEKTVIGKYFPGGRVWPSDEFCKYTDDFEFVNSWYVNGMNYYRTLEEWHCRFWDGVPRLWNQNFDETSIKHWNNYFMLCKCMFAPLEGTVYGVTHYLFKKA